MNNRNAESLRGITTLLWCSLCFACVYVTGTESQPWGLCTGGRIFLTCWVTWSEKLSGSAFHSIHWAITFGFWAHLSLLSGLKGSHSGQDGTIDTMRFVSFFCMLRTPSFNQSCFAYQFLYPGPWEDLCFYISTNSETLNSHLNSSGTCCRQIWSIYPAFSLLHWLIL